LWTKVLKLKA